MIKEWDGVNRRKELPLENLELGIPIANRYVGAPDRSHEDEALFVSANADALEESKKRRILDDAAGLLQHLAVQCVAPALAYFGPACREVPVLAVFSDENDLSLVRETET